MTAWRRARLAGCKPMADKAPTADLAHELSGKPVGDRFDDGFDAQFKGWVARLLASPAPTPVLTEVGRVTEVGDGVAVVSGLARALADELLVFACGVQGIVLDLEPGRLGVILLGPSELITLGEDVRRTRKSGLHCWAGSWMQWAVRGMAWARSPPWPNTRSKQRRQASSAALPFSGRWPRASRRLTPPFR